MRVPKDFMQGLIATVLLAYFGAALFGASLFPNWQSPEENLLQTLIALVMLAAGYYLGSSKSSASKDATIADLKKE